MGQRAVVTLMENYFVAAGPLSPLLFNVLGLYPVCHDGRSGGYTGWNQIGTYGNTSHSICWWQSCGILLVSALPNSGGSFLFMCTPLSVELPHGRGKTWQGACFRVLHTPPQWGSSVLQFWGFLSVYAFTLCHKIIKFDMVTRGGVYLGDQPRLSSQEWGLEFWGFQIFGVFLYVCLHHLPQINQIGHGNTNIWGTTCFRRSATQPHHCICTNALHSII